MTDDVVQRSAEDCWSCPVCGAQDYRRVRLERNRQDYETQFFTCLGCTMIFVEPRLFAEAHRVRELFPALAASMSHQVSARSLALERRFWEARAKRRNGGIPASEATIKELWQRGRLD